MLREVAAHLAMPSLGCAIAALQLCVVLWVVPFGSAQSSGTLAQTYERLHQWDSGHYFEILENGYRSSLTRRSLDHVPGEVIDHGTNVSFFPGYPLAARIVKIITGLGTKNALLLTAQLANALFWIYVMFFFRRWKIRKDLAVGAVAAIALHPSAFFMVSAYSESIFLAGLLGFLYWASVRKDVSTTLDDGDSAMLAVVHGFIMTATRIAGLPLVVAPLVGLLPLQWNRSSLKSLQRPILIALCAAMGGILFFLYCAYAFGHWDLYLLRQRAGWGVVPDYGFFLHWASGLYWPQDFTDLWNPDRWSQFSTVLTFWLLLEVFLFQWGDANVERRKTRSNRWPFLWCAAMTFYISAAGLSGLGMRSMIRYTFPVYVLIILALVQGMHASKSSPFRRPVTWPLLALIVCLLAYLQYVQILRFTNAEWVA